MKTGRQIAQDEDQSSAELRTKTNCQIAQDEDQSTESSGRRLVVR
jgi:hypothetical protein